MMDKKSLAILLLASSFVSSAFANSILNTIITKHSSAIPSIVKINKTIKQTNRAYTDFSGTWMMDCGEGQFGPTVIENDDEYLFLDGNMFRIGRGLEGQSRSNEYYTRSEKTSFEWNTDGSALIVKGVSISKDNIDNSALETDMSKFTLTMKNKQINLDGEFTRFEDVTQIDRPTPVHCVFSKKQ